MSFNPDLFKKAREVIFSRKSSRADQSSVTFNNSSFSRTSCQKHLGLYLDEKLNFIHHIKEKISKVCKGIRVIKKSHYVLPRHSLLTIYKSFIRSILIMSISYMINQIIKFLVTDLKLYSTMQH